MLNVLQNDLRKYYASISHDACEKQGIRIFNPLKKQMDEYDKAHPSLSPFQLKAAQYEIIAEHFTPVLFRNDPFFFEMGLKMAEYDGHTFLSSGGWLFLRNEHLMPERDLEAWSQYNAGDALGLHLCYRIFDMDHHGFPYRNVLSQGLAGILARLRQQLAITSEPRKRDFYESAQRGILAVKKIAERFAEAAVQAATAETEPHARSVYLKLAEIARRVPWNPAETFHEGLAAIWFLHELGSVMDGIGMAIIGSPDQLLIELYRKDLVDGRETPESAEELLKLWMIHTDCKLDYSKKSNEQYNGGEQGDTINVGYSVNELTFMILRIHRELNLIYPKIHCRINENSPQDYLEEIGKAFMTGRNVVDFLNDDLLIPAQIQAGKAPEDAREYVTGGCWEIMLQECEHSEGANCYFDVARVMDLSIQSTLEEEKALGLHFQRPDHARTFEELYQVFMENIRMCLRQLCTLIRKFGEHYSEISPAPFYSACMTGCIESGKDYTEGGSKYNPHGLPLTDLATFVNSLMVFKKLCFEEKKYPLSQILQAVRDNWENTPHLRNEAMKVPHLGDGSGECTPLLKRILTELADFISHFQNERGGSFQCGLYSYSEIYQWAKYMNATPDGRFRGDFLAQGLTPTRLHKDSVTDVFRDLSELPLERFPANSVLTVSLSRNGLDLSRLTALIRGWCKLKASGILQLNCVSREELEDAMIHPEKHQELIVRLYGFSARFVTLEKIRQEEFLSRQLL